MCYVMLCYVEYFPYEVVEMLEPLRSGRKNYGGNKYRYYKNVCAFDIETTRLTEIEQSIMYVWQFQILGYTVYGRTWEQFKMFIEKIISLFPKDEKKRYLVVYVHNLSYEFQFLRGIYEFKKEDVFCLDSRKVAKCYMLDSIEFRCSYIHSNMSLDEFTKKMGVTDRKLSGEKFDYSKRRFPWTPLTDYELHYCTNDVLGLVEAIENEMERDGDDLSSIPLTSTGYLRRDVKNIMYSHVSWGLMKDCQPSLEVYHLLNKAFRGGDTHANRFYTGSILENVKSFDRSSSYPDVMLNCKFPMSKFVQYLDDSKAISDMVSHDKAVLADITFQNIELKDPYCGYPYLAKAKCQFFEDVIIDNGRVMSASLLRTVVTDVDFEIINRDYKFESMVINSAYHANYDYLPHRFTDLITDLYEQKTSLKGIEGREHDYFRAKQKINSAYGLTAQDLLKESVEFDGNDYVKVSNDNQEALDEAIRRPYRSYAWGVWVTAWARYKLHLALWIVGRDFVYSDTDSVKYLGNHDKEFNELNKELEGLSKKSKAFAYDSKNNIHFMGVYENDGCYDRFVTLGAKKYAYEEKGELHVTVSGVNKRKGAEELKEQGGIEKFKEGFIFVKGGGTEIAYNDENYGDYIVDGKHINITSNAVIRDSTYTLGITAEYERLLKNPNILMYNLNTRKALLEEK